MSVKASTTVSMSPSSIFFLRSSRVRYRSLGGMDLLFRSGSPEQAPQERGGVVAVLLHGLTGAVGPAVEHGVQDLLVLVVGVADVHVVHRDLQQHVVQRGLDPGHRV